ncbi:hypothetical protein [Citricoccus sp. NR2]|uniref:hypothetical protein n=1 Tax=Citricoccus sp. NR2 TaxID=3004095 RepID=UPI0022DDCD11|nr:hypothetical protein [Citricoccus sp. NR2]WBL20241.1 hypothetical protein O1A05_06045 [Citricoccus sp. NR2]
MFLKLVDAYVDKAGHTDFAYVAPAEFVEKKIPTLFPMARQVVFESELDSCEPSEPVVVMPPFVSHRSPETEARLDRMLAWASERDQLIVVAPQSELRLRSIRPGLLSRLSNTWNPEVVITGVLDSAGMSRSAEFCMVSLSRKPSNSASMTVCRFFATPAAPRKSEAPTTPTEESIIADFRRLLDLRGGTTEWGFVARDKFNEDWRVPTYDPHLRSRRDDLASLGASVPTSQLFSLQRSFPGSRPAGRPGGQVSRGPVLTGRDVAQGSLDPDPERIFNEDRPVVFLKSGDLLVSEIAQIDGTWHVLEVDDEHAGVAVGHGVVVLRPREPMSRIERDFYIAYLRSNRAASVSDADNTFAGRLRFSSKLLIPVPDDRILESFAALSSARGSFQGWIGEVDVLMKSVFDDDVPLAEVRERLIDGGRALRQASEAGNAASGLDYQVREFYPYPIGYTWRQVRTYLQEQAWSDCHRSVRDAFETLVATAGSIALAACDKLGVSLGSSKAYYKKLGQHGGVSIGDWVNILKETATLKIDVEPDSALGVVRRVLPQVGEVAEAQVRLSAMRNDDAHGRLDPAQVQDVAKDGVEDLAAMLAGCGDLAELRLVLVKQNRWDSREKSGSADVHLLRGDHPIYSTETIEHSESDLETGSLYVVDPLGTWVLLRPWLVHRQCEECGKRSIYRPDHKGKDSVHIKALDHTHHMPDPDVQRTLATIAAAEA